MEMKALIPQQKDEHRRWIEHFTTKYSFQFLSPTYSEVPNVSEIIEHGEATELASELEYYLLGTYPINMGTNIHTQMHELRHSFSEEEYVWHQEHNKLGLNNWGLQAGLTLRALNRVLNRNDLTIHPFPETKGYSSMSFDDKLKLCTLVDREIYARLERLYSEYK